MNLARMFGKHLKLLIASAITLIACLATIVWVKWKAPQWISHRLEQLTGHRAVIGGITFTYRLELVAKDVRIAGAPPFESQTFARADRVILKLGGGNGIWSPSEYQVEGLDIEYLGTTKGDNISGLIVGPSKPFQSNPQVKRDSKYKITIRDGRIRGSVALPHGVLIGFRIPQFKLELGRDGKAEATLADLAVDIEGWGSLRAPLVKAKYDQKNLLLSSGENASIDLLGGPFIEGLALNANLSPLKLELQAASCDVQKKQVKILLSLDPNKVKIVVDSQNLPLRAIGTPAIGQFLGLEKAEASLHALLSIDRSTQHLSYELDGSFRGLDLLHPAVDTSPWRDLNGTFYLKGTVDFPTRKFDILESNFHTLATTLSIKGWLETSPTFRGFLDLHTPPNSPLTCIALLPGQARPVQQALSGLELDGSLGLSVLMEFDSSDWENIKLDINIDPTCSVKNEAHSLSILLPGLKKSTVQVPGSIKLPLGPSHPDFTPLVLMPRHLPSAFLTSEDSKFFHHHGFDIDMIRHALAQDLQNHSFDRGASTITQQLAKNLFLSHQRTVARKLEEAILTWRLQRLLSKERILELYLNVIELGPEIHGVKQAARRYFGKDVTALLPLESVHLAALAPNPHVLSRRFRDGKVDEGWHQRLYDLLGMMKRHGRLSAEDLAVARASHLVLRDRDKDGDSQTTP
jgi:hypothetical protein